MVLPQIEELLLPLLKVIEDKEEYQIREVIKDVIDIIEISEEDKNKTLANNEAVINSRIQTANTYLKKADLIELKRAGYFTISDEGLNVLAQNPEEITEEDLMKYPKFKQFKTILTPYNKEEDMKTNNVQIKEPTNMMEAAYLKQLEKLQNDNQEEAKKGNKTKYFKPKNEKENSNNYEIKSHKKDNKIINKSEENNDNKNFPKYIIYSQFSPAEELLKFAELLERGYITKEEFNKKKEELLEY